MIEISWRSRAAGGIIGAVVFGGIAAAVGGQLQQICGWAAVGVGLGVIWDIVGVITGIVTIVPGSQQQPRRKSDTDIDESAAAE